MPENIVTVDSTINNVFWLDAANAAVRKYCGWHIAPSLSQTMTIDGDGGTHLQIPSLHVTELSQVLSDGVDVTSSVDWSEKGMLELRAGTWSRRLRGIQVTFTHGFDVADVSDVAALIANVAKRAAKSRLVSAQSVNGASATYLTAGGAPLSVPLLQIEMDALAPYKIDGVP